MVWAQAKECAIFGMSILGLGIDSSLNQLTIW
jgi:hypothetical protein